MFPKSFIVLSHCLHMMPRQKPASSSDNESVKVRAMSWLAQCFEYFNDCITDTCFTENWCMDPGKWQKPWNLCFKGSGTIITQTPLCLLSPYIFLFLFSCYCLPWQETRYRQRYLDLMLNSEVRHIFKTRAKVISYVRRYLDNLDFLEVCYLPTQHSLSGGYIYCSTLFPVHV